MITLTADETWLLKDVRLFVEPVEILDSEGKLLGLFVPANLERGKELYAKALAKVDWAEIERRKQSREPGIPLRDTLDRIGLLDKEIRRRKEAGEKEFTIEEAMTYFHALRNDGQLNQNHLGSSNNPEVAGQCASP